jgi:hypothetical protein
MSAFGGKDRAEVTELAACDHISRRDEEVIRAGLAEEEYSNMISLKSAT